MRLLCAILLVSSAFACQHAGKTYKDGEEWSERNAFKMQCKIENNGNWRVIVSACITPDGLEVPINTTKPSGIYEWECKSTGEGQVSLKQAIGKKIDCLGNHPHGSEWTDKSFRFRCDDGGRTAFVGCLAKDGTLIPDGETKEVSGFNIECKKHANGTVTMGATMKADGSCRDSTGGIHKLGETWVESEHFVKTCQNGLPIVTGCEGTDGSYRFFSKVQA